MSVAEGVVDVVVAIGLPAVVDGDPGHLTDHPEVVHGQTPALGVAVEQGEQAGRGRVDPVESPDGPTAGLVEVDDSSLVEQVPGDVEERTGAFCRLGDHLGQSPDRDRCAEHIGEQLSHPVHGQVLMDGQVGSQGSDRRPVTGRGGGNVGEVSLGGAATAASPTFRDVLGHHQADLGELEHLAAFVVDHLGTVQVGTARRARGRRVVDHLVGVCHLGQMLAGRTGLLALLAGRGPTLGPTRCRRFREPFGRRRHRGVARVAAKAFFQVGQLRLEHRHLGPQQLVLGHNLLVGGGVGRGIAGRNSQRYARCSPWWWIRRSGGLNSYLVLIVAGGVVLYQRQPSERKERIRHVASETGRLLLDEYTRASNELQHAQNQLGACVVPCPENRSATSAVFRKLAMADESMSAQQLYDVLDDSARPAVEPLRRFLHNNTGTVFHEARRGGFVLGGQYGITTPLQT
jgi:hypothetical protein